MAHFRLSPMTIGDRYRQLGDNNLIPADAKKAGLMGVVEWLLLIAFAACVGYGYGLAQQTHRSDRELLEKYRPAAYFCAKDGTMYHRLADYQKWCPRIQV